MDPTRILQSSEQGCGRGLPWSPPVRSSALSNDDYLFRQCHPCTLSEATGSLPQGPYSDRQQTGVQGNCMMAHWRPQLLQVQGSVCSYGQSWCPTPDATHERPACSFLGPVPASKLSLQPASMTLHALLIILEPAPCLPQNMLLASGLIPRALPRPREPTAWGAPS